MADCPLTAERLLDCRNFMLAALNFSLLRFLKFKCYKTFTYITQIIHSDAHLTSLKGILSDKPLIIATFKTFNLRKFKFLKKLVCGRFWTFLVNAIYRMSWHPTNRILTSRRYLRLTRSCESEFTSCYIVLIVNCIKYLFVWCILCLMNICSMYIELEVKSVWHLG